MFLLTSNSSFLLDIDVVTFVSFCLFACLFALPWRFRVCESSSQNVPVSIWV